uniref:Proteasome assembly chaperone 2 n=1 Tax=Nothobranchius kadleci TaxID=1051664 RepID=A0A1A8DVT6_NOTKA
MPAVAMGNVGQLAVDLVVSTLNLSRVSYFHTGCLNPMVGNNNPHNSCKKDGEGLHCPAEVFTAAERKLAVLQIRVPIIQKKSKKFRQMLVPGSNPAASPGLLSSPAATPTREMTSSCMGLP